MPAHNDRGYCTPNHCVGQKEGQNDERERDSERDRQTERARVRDRESEKALQGAPKETGGEQSVQIQTGSELLS